MDLLPRPDRWVSVGILRGNQCILDRYDQDSNRAIQGMFAGAIEDLAARFASSGSADPGQGAQLPAGAPADSAAEPVGAELERILKGK